VRPSDGAAFKVREELRTRLIEKLREASKQAEKLVLVTHSMGTMVAYDVLRNCDDCPPVDVLFTLGSPLGISEVQEQLLARDKQHVDFPPALRRWINVYDPLDPVCGADPKMDDYDAFEGRKVEDVRESNWGSWRHTITHYFAGRNFRAILAEVLGLQRP
jgi:pimeloyl-ACP methyl ester carboxylesterase